MQKLSEKKKKVSLVSKFSTIIGISVFYTVVFLSAYNIYASTPIVNQYRVDKSNEFSSISNLVYKEVKDNFESSSLDNPDNLIYTLIKNDLLLHVAVIQKDNGKYLWSTIKEFEGTTTDVENLWVNALFREKFQALSQNNIYTETKDFGDKVVLVAFFMDEALQNLVDVLVKGNLTLSITFILFGVVSASFLARYVTKPIDLLLKGVEEFSRGNLKYRTQINTDDEIGVLGKAFNYMAEKLNELYTSLEKKVQERTVELSEKNSELNTAYKELQETQSLLIHNEKMRSLGELVAGVAHELNNPINFIYGNMVHLKEYSENLITLVKKYEESQEKIDKDKLEEIENFKEEIDFEFLEEDIMDLIKSCTEGAERSKQIVIDLKNFSRLDQAEIKEVNLNESIDSTLNILQNKYKNKVEFVKEYGEVSQVSCCAGQINQVFMNILDNAAQAVENQGNVYIRTTQDEDNVFIEFEDTGCGIDPEVIPKIFDPFFTTKPVGQGSGLGLSITYKIIKSHNGTINVESEKGKGTKFIVKLPKIMPIVWEDNKEQDSNQLEPVSENI